MRVLKDADPADKAEIYTQLGLTLTSHPDEKQGRSGGLSRIDHVRGCVPEDRVEPIGYALGRALTTEFALDAVGGAR